MVVRLPSKQQARVRFPPSAHERSEWRTAGIGQERGRENGSFPVEEGNESASVGKPRVSKEFDSEASRRPHQSKLFRVLPHVLKHYSESFSNVFAFNLNGDNSFSKVCYSDPVPVNNDLCRDF